MGETAPTVREDQRPGQSSSFTNFVDPDFDPEQERLLDQKFDSVWQPQWAGESRVWRIFVRGAVIGLAVALLWLTSLTLATTIAGIYVAAPTYDEAVNQWSFAVQITQQEQANAGECVTREVATCHTVLNITYNDLLLKIQEQALRNDLVVQAEANEAGFCQKSWDGAFLATSTLLKKILVNSSIYSNGTSGSTCSSDDVVHLMQLLGDVSQQKSDVYLKNVQYSRDSNSFLSSAADSAKNRTDYDENYLRSKGFFLGNWSIGLYNATWLHIGDIDAQFKDLNVTIDSLIGCISLNGTCNFSVNARQAYLDMKTSVEDAYNTTKNKMAAYAGLAAQWNATALAYFSAVDNIFAQLETIGSINKVLKQLGINNPLDVDYPRWQDFGPIPGLPAIAASLNIPTPDAQFAQVKPTLQKIRPGFDAVRQKVRDAALRWQFSINQSFYFPGGFSFPTILADYNPPPIVVNTSGFQGITNNFLDSSRVSLDGFNTLTNVSFDYNMSNFSYANIVKHLPAFSHYSLLSSPFSGEFNFYSVFTSIGNVMFLLISADIIYRVFHSVAIVRKYTRMSELGLPVIDIREFSAAKTSTNPTLALYQLCTSPLILVVILAVVALIILGALVALYVPMYTSYQAGCVQSHNGTLITRNAYAFAYNYAAAEANEASGDGLSKYDKQRTEYCTAATQQFNDRQSQAQDTITKVRQTYDNNANDLALYQRCMVADALPPADQWLNLTNYTSPFTNESIALRLLCDRAGVYVTDGLGDASFDCELLPPCNLTCTGPDKDALQAVTYDSGCTTEWTFHAGLFRTLLGLLVFVCLNISRSLLMTAVIRLSWRQLTSKGFEFQGTCTKMGTVIGLEERLKVAVDAAIKSYERGALIMLVGAVLIHIPYLVVLNKYGNIQSHQ